MALANRERVVFESAAGAMRDAPVAIVHAPREAASSAANDPIKSGNRRPAQRADLERLRRRLAEPCDLKERDLLTLLSYAVGGDGDPIVGLLDDVRGTIGMMSEVPSGTEPSLLASLERRLSVALELYARATAEDGV